MLVCRLRDGNPFGALPAFWAAPCASDRFQYRAGEAGGSFDGTPFDGTPFDGADSDGAAGFRAGLWRRGRELAAEHTGRSGRRAGAAGAGRGADVGCGLCRGGGRRLRGSFVREGRAGGGPMPEVYRPSRRRWIGCVVGRRSDGCGTLRAAGSRTGGGAIRALRNRAVGRAGVGGISGGSGRGGGEREWADGGRSAGEPERRAKA